MLESLASGSTFSVFVMPATLIHSSAWGQAERISKLALITLLQILVFLFLGVDLPPILTDIAFTLPNTRFAQPPPWSRSPVSCHAQTSAVMQSMALFANAVGWRSDNMHYE